MTCTRAIACKRRQAAPCGMIGEPATPGDARKPTPQLSPRPPSEIRSRRTSKPLVRSWCNGQPALSPETPARPSSDEFGARRALDQKETVHVSIHTPTSGWPLTRPDQSTCRVTHCWAAAAQKKKNTVDKAAASTGIFSGFILGL